MGPDSTRADTVQREALSRGLLILTAGMYGNVLRTLMPIGITDDLLEESLGVLEAALTVVD